MRAAIAIFILFATTASVLAATTYKYDTLGRLYEVCYDNGQTIVYNYDPMGNRTSVVIQGTCP